MLKAYASMGHDVDLVHFRSDGEVSFDEALDAGLRRHVDIRLGKHRFRRQMTLLPPLAFECEASKRGVGGLGPYDVVQSETSAVWPVVRDMPSRKRVVVFHDDDSARLASLSRLAPTASHRAILRLGSLKYSRLQARASSQADAAWFVSQDERERIGRGKKPTSIVPNGADDELWSIPPGASGVRGRVLFVGPRAYQANEHGLRWFLGTVWPGILAAVPEARLRVVGLGWHGFGEWPAVEFAGWRPALVDEYANAAVVVAPVFAGGGTNLKVVEAMAAGRPVVTSVVGARGLPESSGLCAASDSRAFAAELRALLVGPALAVRAGEANRRTVDHLRWSRIWRDAASELDELASMSMSASSGRDKRGTRW
jgi:glycosyltransferase involved in cell wall biosynthesis